MAFNYCCFSNIIANNNFHAMILENAKVLMKFGGDLYEHEGRETFGTTFGLVYHSREHFNHCFANGIKHAAVDNDKDKLFILADVISKARFDVFKINYIIVY